MMISDSEGCAVKSKESTGLPTNTGDTPLASEADKNRAQVLEKCRTGRDNADRLGLFLKEKSDEQVRRLMMSGDLQMTKDSREGLGGNLEKIQRSLRYFDRQVQEWERWYVLATTPEDEMSWGGDRG